MTAGKLVTQKNIGFSRLHHHKNNLVNNELHFGSLSLDNLKSYPMRRLSYNPYFDDMLTAMNIFLGL